MKTREDSLDKISRINKAQIRKEYLCAYNVLRNIQENAKQDLYNVISKQVDLNLLVSDPIEARTLLISIMNEKELLELGFTSNLEDIEQTLKLKYVLVVRDYM